MSKHPEERQASHVAFHIVTLQSLKETFSTLQMSSQRVPLVALYHAQVARGDAPPPVARCDAPPPVARGDTPPPVAGVMPYLYLHLLHHTVDVEDGTVASTDDGLVF